MIVKIIVLGIAGMLAYRWLAPPRPRQPDQVTPPREDEGFTEYEEVDE